MTRQHRRWHLRLWLVIGPMVVLGLIAAVVSRPVRAASGSSQSADVSQRAVDTASNQGGQP